jgi:hypothetical protein
MAVRIRLLKIEITPGVPPPGQPVADGAIVHLEIFGGGGSHAAAIPMSYLIRPFRSLDEAVEEARRQLHAFAQELAAEANNPLVRTPGGP